MDLIIKPTGRCNFNCTFCSADGLNIAHPKDEKVPQQIKDFITAYKPTTLIVTGGEPLMMKPEYYYELHEFSGLQISITSNLKDFYYNPEKWADLFKEEWFGVATSFNYGDSRLWDPKTVYTEEMFLKVMDKFCKYTGRNVPCFLAVIDSHNENTVLDHVYLAKRLNTQCKLNNAVAMGRQDVTFPRYKMFQYYLQIIDMGLARYESYCATRNQITCPRNIELLCYTQIRCCYVDNDDKLHVSVCDEQMSKGFELSEDEIIPKNPDKPEVIEQSDMITPECAYCELFRLCNACKSNRTEAKKDPNYCKEMKKLESRIKETGWAL